MNRDKRLSITTWIIIIILAVYNMTSEVLINLGPIIPVLMFVLFTFIHGSKNFGIKKMLFFFTITFIVSWGYETLSILTGFPFGNYHYTDLLGPKLWLVPVIIMAAYFGFMYSSWMIAHVLTSKYSLRITKSNLISIPIISTFVMVLWDIVMDPSMSTLKGNWIWEEGGAYFGVPFVNYLGWFLCVFTIFILFSIYLLKNKNFINDKKHIYDKGNWIQPIIFYGAAAVKHLVDPIFHHSREIVAPNGVVWNSGDLLTSGALICIYTMMFVVILSLVRINIDFNKTQ